MSRTDRHALGLLKNIRAVTQKRALSQFSSMKMRLLATIAFGVLTGTSIGVYGAGVRGLGMSNMLIKHSKSIAN